VSSLLPEAFADLEPLAAKWAIASGNERYHKRVTSSMDQLQAFYDRMFPRTAEAIAYLDALDVAQPLPAEAERLLNLVYSLITVSLAVEVWKQPRVVDSGESVMTRVEMA
jgi:hypothetical protein